MWQGKSSSDVKGKQEGNLREKGVLKVKLMKLVILLYQRKEVFSSGKWGKVIFIYLVLLRCFFIERSENEGKSFSLLPPENIKANFKEFFPFSWEQAHTCLSSLSLSLSSEFLKFL